MSENLSILLIDDNPLDRRLVVREISREFPNVQFHQVTDQISFFQTLESSKYDLVITDYDLRWSTGLQILQDVKARSPGCPVIMFTGTGTEEIAVEAMKQGLDDYVLKSAKHYGRLPSAMRSALVNAKKHQEMTERIHLLTRAVEQSQSIIMITDIQGDIEYVNPKFTEVAGYEPAEVIGQNPRILKSNEVQLAHENLWPVISSGGTWKGEFHNKKKNGNLFWEAATITPIKGGDGEITHYLAVKEDISKHKEEEAERLRLENRIFEQANQLRLILQTVPEGVVLLDSKGKIILANKIASEDLTIMGQLQEGNTITQLGDHSLVDLLSSPPTKGLWHEVRINKQTFEVIARPVDNGADAENWVLVINEVTQAREIREQLYQQERLAAVGQLATGIAHDFNNIIAVILLYSQMSMRADNLPETVQRRLKTISEQSHHAHNLIEQILDFSRQSVLEQSTLDFSNFLVEQIDLLTRVLPENIEIHLIGSTDSRYIVNADSTRMQQMITNLVLNARDAMPDGGILYVRLERSEVKLSDEVPIFTSDVEDWLKLTIQDSGVGIPPDIIPHIFEPFYTTKNPGQGTGLGLAQVHGIVGQHDGHIHVNSKVNEGTAITIYLPLVTKKQSDFTDNHHEQISLGQGELLLVVEDNAALRLTLVESLEQLSYQVVAAAHGNEAMAVMNRQGDEVSLILSDVVMPHMGGIALCKTLREAGWRTPIIMLSGHPLENDFHDLAEIDIAHWLSKPISIEKLAEVIAESIRRPMLSNTFMTSP